MTGFGYFIWSCEVVLKNKPTFFPKQVYFISFLVFSTSIMLALAGAKSNMAFVEEFISSNSFFLLSLLKLNCS